MDYQKIYEEAQDEFHKKIYKEARGAMNVGQVHADLSPEVAKKYGNAYDDKEKRLRLTNIEHDEKGNVKPGTGTLTNLGLQGYIAAFLDNGEVRKYESVMDEYLCEEAVYSDKKVDGYSATSTRDGEVVKYRKDTDFIYDLGNPELTDSSVKPRKVSSSDKKDYKLTAFNNVRLLCAYAAGRDYFTYIDSDKESKLVSVDDIGLRRITDNGTEKVPIKEESVKRFLFIQTMPAALEQLFNKVTSSKGDSDYAVKNKLLTVTGDDDAADRNTRIDYVLSLLLADGDDTEDGKGKLRGLFNEWLGDCDTALMEIDHLGNEAKDFEKQNPLGYLATDILLKNSNINRWDVDVRESTYLNEKGLPQKGYLLIKDWLDQNLTTEKSKSEFEKILKFSSNQTVIKYLKEHYTGLYDYLMERDNGRLVNMAKEAFEAPVRNSKIISDIGNTVRMDANVVDDETKPVWKDEESTVYQRELDSEMILSSSAFRKDVVRDVLIDINAELESEDVVATEEFASDDDYSEIDFKDFEKDFNALLDAIRKDETGNYVDAKKYLVSSARVDETEFVRACDIAKKGLEKYGDVKLLGGKVKFLQYAPAGTKDVDYKNAMIVLLESVLGHIGKIVNNGKVISYSFDSKTNSNVPFLMKYPYLVMLYLVIKGGAYSGYIKKPGKNEKDAINVNEALRDIGAFAKSFRYTDSNGYIQSENFRNYPEYDSLLGKDVSDRISNLDYLAAGIIYQDDLHDEMDAILDTVKRLLEKGGYNLEKLDKKIEATLLYGKEVLSEDFHRKVYQDAKWSKIFELSNT